LPERFEFFRPRKIKKRRLGPSFNARYGPRWEEIRKQVLIRDNWQCKSCGRVCSEKWEAQVDHILPKDGGGSDQLENLQVLCIRCHRKKTQQGL
jgi:5-methylcytosine-specific restriction protein A